MLPLGATAPPHSLLPVAPLVRVAFAVPALSRAVLVVPSSSRTLWSAPLT